MFYTTTGNILQAQVDALVNACRNIAVPALDTGLGGLRWEDVQPLVWNALARLEHADTGCFHHSDSRSGIT